MQKIAFLPKAFGELRSWAEEDRQILVKIFELIRDVERNPFSGIGKPEPLKHKLFET